MLALAFYLLESPPSSAGWFSIPNLIGLLGYIALIGSAIIVLKNRKREEVHSTQVGATAAWKETAGAFEKNLAAAQLTIKDTEDERDTVQTAYTTLSGVIIKEILNDALAWRENRLLKENARLRERVRELESRLSVFEPGGTSTKGADDGRN
jgi:hypothetical protein